MREAGAGGTTGRGPLPRVTLRKPLARAIRAGHPWVFREALAPGPPIPNGRGVLVADGRGRPLARGFWDAESAIAVRLLGAPEIDPDEEIERRIAAALERRLAAIDRRQTDAFRWIHGEGDRLPGFHADLYGDALALRFDGEGARAFYAGLPATLRAISAHHHLPLRAIVERRRRGKGEAAEVTFGTLAEGELEIRENGLLFGVDLRHGQKGGLFLDQRENRAFVRAQARGRRVLNLFGYTGGFSIYAAAGGARETVTVDLAAPAIAAARRNLERNQLSEASNRLIAGDAFRVLAELAAAGERFDLVVSDPPSFAPNRGARPAALRAYRRLHRLCAAVTAEGGLLCAASCSSQVDRAAFLATVEEGAREAGRRFALREMRGAGLDHPVLPHFPEGEYLKFAAGVVYT